MHVRALALLAVLTVPGWARTQDAEALQATFQKIIKKAEPSIACILVSRSEDYGRYQAAPSAVEPGQLGSFDAEKHLAKLTGDQPEAAAAIKALDLTRADHVPEAFGSGVVIDEKGLILTNAHVLRRATKIYVRLPGNRGSYADIYAADPRSDLAVLKLLKPPAELSALKIGDADKLRRGQWIVTLSNPYEPGFAKVSPTAAIGVVSNFRQFGPEIPNESESGRQPLYSFGTLLQIGSLLPPAKYVHFDSSGGALLNLDGELVGLTTALAVLQGNERTGGFALPLDRPMRRILEVLRDGKEVEYGFLGIQMPLNAAKDDPVRISDVINGGPAAAAGLHAGDYVVTIDGRPIRNHNDLLLNIGIGLAGNDVKLEVARGSFNGPRRAVTVRLAKSPVSGPVIAANRPPAIAGLRVEHASVVARQSREIPVGVAIREVLRDSPADRARLQAGKVIRRVDGRLVASPEAFYREMRKAGKTIELTVLDFSGQMEETITIENK
jgi:S1-C subfamily serine protease